ncbi:glycosyltransferase family 2 protein [Pedobacter paludis]|uniref:Glycosyltransferase 2-like domain-containing protein n=1 Tax=Pedobacter paludis TaxID=2203212 RepID=A0A317F547_9SPHI|nr:glycosyltransferase family 2 protein [Pedobacter paludis]PWS32999.1 hypothetical protein DF947_08005 [Pedobacter paludis]
MLLTIGIPVFNGQKYIEEAIKAIIKCELSSNEVEIIICDNASTDKTIEIAQTYKSVKVIEHQENIGFDGNLNRIFNYACGKYVWAIGADDLILDKNINDLVSLLRNTNCGVIFIGGVDSISEPYRILSNPEEFLIMSNFRSGFFSNNIIRKNLWVNCELKQFLASGWIHYAVILQAICMMPTIVTRKKHVIENPGSNEVKTWNRNGAGLIVGLRLVEIFQVMPKWGYGKQFIKRTKGVIKNSYPREIIVSKIRGLKVSKSLLEDFIRLFKEFPSFWLRDLWFLLIPSFLYKIPAYVLKLLKYGT